MRVSSAAGWAEKYRPKSFNEVIGQQAAVDILRARIASGSSRNLILEGPTGSGKTTLAEIYARAVMCMDPQTGGETCGTCSSCLMFENGEHKEFTILGAADSDKEAVEYLIGPRTEYEPRYARRHVIFFDEAESLTLPAREVLLTALEDGKATFIFALINGSKLPDRFRDRCEVVSLNAPTAAEGQALIERMSAEEGFSYDHRAFELLWRLTPRFRGFIAQLETLLEDGRQNWLSEDRVREHALKSATGRILSWLDACLAGNPDDASEALDAIRMTPPEASDAILDLIQFVKGRYVGPHLVSNSLSIWSLLITPDEGTALSERFAERAEALGIRPIDLFDHMLEFWSFVPLRMTEAVLQVHAARFHDLLWVEAASDGQPARGVQSGQVPVQASYASSKPLRPSPRFRSDKKPDDSGWIDAQQARKIYEAATFLPQAYGQWFNTRLTICPRELGLVNEAGAKKLASALFREMQQWVASRLGPDDAAAQLHRIVLHESLQDGIETTAILHLPSQALSNELHNWLGGFLDRRKGARAEGAFQWSFAASRTWKGSTKRHWSLVQLLWRGVDPFLRQGTAMLINHLNVSARDRRPAGNIANRRLAISRSLGDQAMSEYSKRIAPALSAWQESDWDRLFIGWEWRVFEARNSALTAHERELAALDFALTEARDSLTQKNLGSQRDKLIETWQKRTDFGHSSRP